MTPFIMHRRYTLNCSAYCEQMYDESSKYHCILQSPILYFFLVSAMEKSSNKVSIDGLEILKLAVKTNSLILARLESVSTTFLHFVLQPGIVGQCAAIDRYVLYPQMCFQNNFSFGWDLPRSFKGSRRRDTFLLMSNASSSFAFCASQWSARAQYVDVWSDSQD